MTTKTATRKPRKAATNGHGPDIVAGWDIAQRCGIANDSFEKWVQRSKKYRGKVAESEDGGPAIDWAFPEPRWIVAGRVKVWDWNLDVLPWLERTGRLDYVKH